MSLRRGGLIGSIVINGLTLLLSVFLILEGAPTPRRAASILFVLMTGAALAVSTLLLRRRMLRGRRSKWLLSLLGLPPLLVVAALSDGFPLWWPVWAGGPIVHDAINEGPLPADIRAAYRLPPTRLGVLGRDGVSISIRPSFGAVDYDLDLAPAGLVLPGRPTARLWVRPKGGESREYRFHVPWEDLEVTLQAFDARARRWRGQRGMATDGTPIMVERMKEGRVTSIDTNAVTSSEPANPAAQLRTDVHALLLAYGPTGSVPRSYDWDVDETTCSERALNTPVPQGTIREAACTGSR